MLGGVQVVEHGQRHGIGHRPAGGAHVLAERVGTGVDLGEERRVGDPRARDVGTHPLDRVLELPRLALGRRPVAGGVIGGGVRAHAVGEGLDEGGSTAADGPGRARQPRRPQRPARRCRRPGRPGTRSRRPA